MNFLKIDLVYEKKTKSVSSAEWLQYKKLQFYAVR